MPDTPVPPVRRATSSKAPSKEVPEDDDSRPYVIGKEIGKGSFATVYRGYHEETHQQVAIKTVRKDILTAKLFDNLQSEIDILKSLSHRHITKLIDIVRAERNIYLIMEFCAGGDLTNYIKKRGRVEGLEYIPHPGGAPQYYPHPRAGGLNETVVRSFLRQLARALKFLRHRNLIHRDIKPQNLLLNPASADDLAKGHPLGVPILKVADFGFARSLPNAMMAETLCGSPLYMAPEILRYEKYDGKADLWSVGAVLYEMAVGKTPFRAQNHLELLKKIEHSKGIKFPDEDPQKQLPGPNNEPPPPSVPADVKRLIRNLLKRNPVERCSYEDFFSSTALANSKHLGRGQVVAGEDVQKQGLPENHRVIPPEVLDPQAMIPPSKFNFRKRDSTSDIQQAADGDGGSSPRMSPASPTIARLPEISRAPSSAANQSPRSQARALSTEGSIIPGETEEDGLLRREYVMVGDTRAVEFNRAVDEINSARQRPLRENKAPPTPLSEDALNDFTNRGSPPNVNTTFPPPQHVNAPQLSSSPTSAASRAASNALTRALNLASKKLFGQSNPARPSYYRDYTSSSPRRLQIIAGRTGEDDGERDPVEDQLLADLEELAQKTDVLTHWADEMYEYVKAVPQKPLADPNKFIKREGEAQRQAVRRKNADMEAEYNAVTCVAVYMLLMSFSQRGIDKLRNHQEHQKMRHPDGEFVVSEGFDDALTWFKDHFIKCNDRAALVKTWLPTTYDGRKSWLDQLVYDRALNLSRTAARKELLDQAASPDECEKLYEESLWCLYALQDDLLQSGNPFMEEDRATIATWIKRTKLRLVRCRNRMIMNDHDRVVDARADQNLVDVARSPAPWEAKPPEQQQPSSPSQATRR